MIILGHLISWYSNNAYNLIVIYPLSIVNDKSSAVIHAHGYGNGGLLCYLYC